MLRRFQNITRILLFACLAAPFVFTYTWLQYQKHLTRVGVKEAMIAKTNGEDLTLLRFSKSEAEKVLSWEHSDEFEYQDEMYDVVQAWVKGDTLYYRCWPDDEETEINKKLENLVTHVLNKDTQRKDSQERFSRFMKKLYTTDRFDWHSREIATATFYISPWQNKYKPVVLPPPGPPPRV